MVEGVQTGGLKPCPFCGSESSRLQKKERGYYWLESLVAEIRIEKAAYYVVCNRCHARGGVATGRFVGYVRTAQYFGPFDDVKIEVPTPEGTTTRDEVKKTAVDLWNIRTGRYSIEI